MALPRDKYQIVLAEGCDTYQIGTAFKENPNKAGKNIDVVGTNAASNAASPASVENFVAALLARDSLQRLRPQPVSGLLTGLDNASWGMTPMYGIHLWPRLRQAVAERGEPPGKRWSRSTS